MPIDETLPKTGKSKDWLAHADKELKKFKDYHSETNILGQIKRPEPLSDDYSRVLSQNELSARKMGMELLRNETKRASEANTAEYNKGGRVKNSGPAKLHAGEKVVSKNRKARKVTRPTVRR